MTRKGTFAALDPSMAALILALSGQPAEAQDCNFSLRNPTASFGPLHEAIAIVNATVDDPEHILSLVDESGPEPNKIPVFDVRSRDSRGLVARVQRGCRAILIGGAEFDQQFARLAGQDSLIDGNKTEMLALLLLHELGHIKHGHYGPFLPRSGRPGYNLEASTSKTLENEADMFVVDVLSKEIQALGTGDANLPAVMVALFVSKLSLHISVQAALDCFGCRPLGSREIFWDHSMSHENLEYRLLKMNHELAPSATSQRLIDDFENLRTKNSRGGLRIIVGPNGESRDIAPGTEEYEVFQNLMDDLGTLQRQ